MLHCFDEVALMAERSPHGGMAWRENGSYEEMGGPKRHTVTFSLPPRSHPVAGAQLAASVAPVTTFDFRATVLAGALCVAKLLAPPMLVCILLPPIFCFAFFLLPLIMLLAFLLIPFVLPCMAAVLAFRWSFSIHERKPKL
eukprot:TRINITY_DN1260_c0_g1_i3.p1 TRINITY_DN1260_c0_g1~~TRINITY_DN1260_c0_g1_i3.p1  ORF type:complete len:141 (-),score=16.53 TRINITY_DN1260_c0_g1_i3:83-505(-)